MDLPGEKNGTLEAGDGREQGRRPSFIITSTHPPSFIYLCMCLVSYLLGSLCGTEGRLGLLPRYMYDTRAGLLTSGSPGEIGMQAGDITLPSHHHRHHLPSRIRMSLVRANFLVQHEPWGDWDAPPAAFIPLQTGGGSYLLGLHWQASGRVESLSSLHRSVCL